MYANAIIKGTVASTCSSTRGTKSHLTLLKRSSKKECLFVRLVRNPYVHNSVLKDVVHQEAVDLERGFLRNILIPQIQI